MKTLNGFMQVNKVGIFIYIQAQSTFFKEEKCPTILSQIFTKKLYKRQIWKTYDDMLLYLGDFF